MSPPITDKEFEAFRRFLHQTTGIQLHQGKKALVRGRLSRRLMQHQLGSYGAYFQFIHSPQGQLEKQHCIDLLTTNETYFFREPRHFQWLEQHLLNRSSGGAISTEPFRVWSAACSSGEETYSLAMTLRSHLQGPWEILGSDISTRMLERARNGHYELQRAQGISPEYLRRYCLRGTGTQEGTFLLRRELRERVHFRQINLNTALPAVGMFDLIFLRNVMIYFDRDTKHAVVQRLLAQLKPGGHLCIGHSESLNDIPHALRIVAPSIFFKPERGMG